MEFIENQCKFIWVKSCFYELRLALEIKEPRYILNELEALNRCKYDTSVMVHEVKEHGVSNIEYLWKLYKDLFREYKVRYREFRIDSRMLRENMKGV